MTLWDLMETYLLEPIPAHLDALRTAVTASPTYAPMISLHALTAAAEGPSGTAEEVAARLERDITSHMPGLLLSPRAHSLLGRSHRTLGREADAVREEKIAALSFAGIRGEGDGGEAAPFEVLRVEDEYDVFSCSRLRPTGQVLRETDHGAFDVHTLEDGTEVWFRLLWRDAGTG
ncbi:hypothetical protein [Brachybacterium sp. GU-2]|uniref:hypothetical protein n=1 Tax=Brachybacterium sp. GU-2 TaxID=3069708 RepID=UPI00280C20FF|nr:hypothetical protein [Brachybacterium sp. GU-2]WME22338.1 hypothetical protein RBL05_12485 [Brachybacterium sp. GU-2]